MTRHRPSNSRRPAHRLHVLTHKLLILALSCVPGAWCQAAEPPVGQMHVYKKVGERELRLYVVKPGDWQVTDQRPALGLGQCLGLMISFGRGVLAQVDRFELIFGWRFV